MISVAVKQPDMKVKNIIWSSKDLANISLAKRILEPPQLKLLYPDFPKEVDVQPLPHAYNIVPGQVDKNVRLIS